MEEANNWDGEDEDEDEDENLVPVPRFYADEIDGMQEQERPEKTKKQPKFPEGLGKD